ASGSRNPGDSQSFVQGIVEARTLLVFEGSATRAGSNLRNTPDGKSGSLGSSLRSCRYFLHLIKDRVIGRTVGWDLADVHIPNGAGLVQDERRRVSDTIVLVRIKDPICLYHLMIGVRQELKLCARRLAHRPCELWLVDADSDEVRSGLLDLVIVLSQTGELRGAGRSPVAPVEYDDYRPARRVVLQRDGLSVGIGQREIRRFVSDLWRCPLDLGRRSCSSYQNE